MAERNNTLRDIHTRDIINIIESGNLTISTDAYTAGDYLHTNVITYSSAFLEQTDCYSEIVGVRIREHTEGTLQKPALKIFFFDSCDIAPTANAAFDLTDGTDTTIDNLQGVLTVAALDYVELPSGASNLDAINNTYFTKPLEMATNTNRIIQAVAMVTGTPTFHATGTIQIDLIVKMK